MYNFHVCLEGINLDQRRTNAKLYTLFSYIITFENIQIIAFVKSLNKDMWLGGQVDL